MKGSVILTKGKFSFDQISDLISPKELQEAKFMGGSRSAIYAFLNRPGVPVVSIGKRKYITKAALMGFFEKSAMV